MPWPSKLLIRAAWTWFVIGLLMGAALMIFKIWLPTSRWWVLRVAHVHVLVFGFGAQWIMGIAYWIYPRRGKRFGMHDRGVAICWALLNAGMLLRAIFGPCFAAGLSPAFTGPSLLVGSLMQALAGIMFVPLIWKRIWSPPPVS